VPSPASGGLIVSTRALVAAGAASGQTVSGLTGGGTYYFTLWTQDDAGNLSPPSPRVASVATAARFLTGSVRLPVSGDGIGGVLAEAFDKDDVRRGDAATSADLATAGVYKIAGLAPGSYRVVVSYTVEDFSNSAGKDGIGEAQTGVDFTLSRSYTLATIEGQALVVTPGHTAGLRLAGLRAAAAAETGAFVELYSKDRLIAAAPVHRDGHYALTHLLPSTYQARVFDGAGYSPMQTLKLHEGEVVALGSAAGLLPNESVFAFPNPARDSVTLRFESDAYPLEASVAVYDVAGALVRDIPNAEIQDMGSGVHHAVWDTRNGRHKRVASGVYLFVVKVRDVSNSARKQVTKKLAIIR